MKWLPSLVAIFFISLLIIKGLISHEILQIKKNSKT